MKALPTLQRRKALSLKYKIWAGRSRIPGLQSMSPWCSTAAQPLSAVMHMFMSYTVHCRLSRILTTSRFPAEQSDDIKLELSHPQFSKF